MANHTMTAPHPIMAAAWFRKVAEGDTLNANSTGTTIAAIASIVEKNAWAETGFEAAAVPGV